MLDKLAILSSSTAVSLLAQLNVGVIGFSCTLALLVGSTLGGEGGGGIATADGIRGFGVLSDGRPPPKPLGVPKPIDRPGGLGVISEPPLGGLVELAERDGLAETTRAGLRSAAGLDGLAKALPLADNCDAVTPIYLLARLPAVILLITDADDVVGEGTGFVCVLVTDFGRAANPKLDEGVTRPLERGVTRPP